MFEKEAEKYTSNLDECRTKDLMGDAFKDGAEFGYNKANEWHRVSDKLTEMKEEVVRLKKENEQLQEKLNIRSCQNCKHNNKSCPNDGSCVYYSKWEDYKNQQLTKAKEIIKDYMIIAKGAHITACGVPEENRTIHVLELNEEAEEFLNSEIEE